MEYARLERKGRGLALRTVWPKTKGKVIAYMDIDLSTGLEAFPLIVQKCLDGCDVATGSRHLSASLVDRSLKRAILSRVYNEFVRLFLRSRIHDHQCGFKAVRKDSFDKLAPLLKNENWFFDTELLIQAQRNGMTIAELPVRWSEDRMRKSTVRIVPTIREYVLNVVRLMK